MEEDIQSETGGHFSRLLVSQINAGRDEDEDVDGEKAQADAQEIYDVSTHNSKSIAAIISMM